MASNEKSRHWSRDSSVDQSPYQSSTDHQPNPSVIFAETSQTLPYILTRKLCYRKDDRAMRDGSNEPLRRYSHSKLSKMAACRHLGFDVSRNSAIRSADPENPTLEPNMKCIGSPVAEIWPFACLGGIWNPHFKVGEVIGVSDGTIRKSDGGFL